MRKSSTLKLLAGASLLIVATQGMAQWQWKDNSGRTVFSDRPPPASIPLKNIIKQPGVAAPVSVTVSNTSTRALPKSNEAQKQAAATEAEAVKPKQSAAEKAAAAKKKKEEEAKKAKTEAEAEKKMLAEKEQAKKAKADNCRRARTALATLDSNLRVATVNEKGERIVMDDAARSAERKRLQKVVSSNCS